MSKAKDTLLRQLSLLRLIPRKPHCIATTTLQLKLEEQGYSVSLRTIQRDLDSLSSPFALVRDETQSPHRWSFMREAPLDLAAIDTPTALALHLAEGHLANLLPASVLTMLTPQLRRARQHLDSLSQNDLAHWARRVRALPNGKALQPAEISEPVWQNVSTALLEQRQLQVQYLSRSKAKQKPLLLHPAGLVSRHTISYLIASVDGYDDLRQFALHRTQQAECLNDPARKRPDFEIDHYIRQDLNTAAPIAQVELIADVSPQIAWLLSETPLSPGLSLEPLEGSDWQRLRATVPDDQETLWWVFGLGENVRVQAPANWVAEFRERLKRMEKLYAPL